MGSSRTSEVAVALGDWSGQPLNDLWELDYLYAIFSLELRGPTLPTSNADTAATQRLDEILGASQLQLIEVTALCVSASMTIACVAHRVS